MQITYKRNGLKNYMVVKNERNDAAGLHEKMIVRNDIAHLARMTPQSIDGYSYYYYDIQGKVSLGALFSNRSMKKDEISTILRGLSGFLTELERYLLSPDEVIFAPSDVWLSPDTLEPSFIYVPGLIPDEEHGIKSLAEFLTEHVDSDDRDAAAMAYEYLEMTENGYILPNIGEHMNKRHDAKQERINIEDSYRIPPIGPDDYWDLKEGIADEMKPFFENDDKEKKHISKIKLAYICMGLIIAVTAVYIAFVLDPSLLPITLTDEEYIIAGVSIAVVFALVLIGVMCVFGGKTVKEEDKPRTIVEDETVSAYKSEPEDEIEYMEYENYKNDDTESEKTVLLKKPKLFGGTSSMPVLQYDDGRHIVIRQFPFLMGKMKTRVDEVIEGEGISRIHAMIKEQDGKYYLSDLNSLNGTAVNGKLMDANETMEIADGDVIMLADTALSFQTGRKKAG